MKPSELFVEFLCKIDAVASIVRARLAGARLVWSVLLVASFAACAYLIVSAIVQYTWYRVTTNVRYLSDQQALAPTLTICGVAPFSSAYARDLLDKANVTGGEDDDDDYWRQYVQVEHYMNSTRGSFLTLDEKLRLHSFEARTATTSQLDAFETFFHPKYFGCLRWNANGTHRSTACSALSCTTTTQPT